MLGQRVTLTAMSVASSLLSFASYTLLLKYSEDAHQVDQIFFAGSLPLAVSGTISGVLLYLVPARLNQLDDVGQQLTTAALGICFLIVSSLFYLSALTFALLWGQSVFHWMLTGFVLSSGAAVLTTIGLCFGQSRASYMASGTAPLAAASGLLLGALSAVVTQQPWLIVLGQAFGSLLALWFSTVAWRRRLQTHAAPLTLAAASTSISALRKNLLPIGVATLAFTVFQPIDAFVCTQLPTGCLSIISYAQRITMALGTVISLGAFIVAAKTSSDAFRAGGLPAIKGLANRETTRIISLGIVAWGLFITAGKPVLGMLFHQSEMSDGDLELLLDCASAMIIGVGPMTTVPYLFRVHYSTAEYRVPACVGLAVPVTYAAIALTLAPRLGALSLAVAFAFVWWLAFIASSIALNLKR